MITEQLAKVPGLTAEQQAVLNRELPAIADLNAQGARTEWFSTWSEHLIDQKLQLTPEEQTRLDRSFVDTDPATGLPRFNTVDYLDVQTEALARNRAYGMDLGKLLEHAPDDSVLAQSVRKDYVAKAQAQGELAAAGVTQPAGETPPVTPLGDGKPPTTYGELKQLKPGAWSAMSREQRDAALAAAGSNS